VKWDDGKIKMTLMKDKDTFVVTVNNLRNPNRGYAMYYEHTDLAILRAYLNEVSEVSIPPEKN
jgi:hypothetical protein